ncbi:MULTISPECIES: GNAT family N-acetyltransferase [unclassified Actinobaculum]|uniref:GNAT family N-acetyltransferase n=1 Tax=unclassified Actinobaculum TaxID=2609299 RepID=UPI000D526FC6|nr:MULTISPECIES: GNAT family N-acetyltransferase [unclassified Actinobaculum]AWE42058.1 GNAT family N-acetyltransferase [Actinobaculum sp. 313]RTE50608.1 GNAT family N-acetyltransferase [Actinobaculum sp. 352]
MSVEVVTESTPELAAAMNRLVPQLSRSTPPLSEEYVRSMVAQKGVYLLVFRSEDAPEILGMLTLATFDIPTGRRAWIEDVVVHEDARGQGAGQQLVEAAVSLAQEVGAKSVDLTSRPSREAANRLYRRCGFVERETNIYRYQG